MLFATTLFSPLHRSQCSPHAGDRDLLNLRSSIYEAEDAAGVLSMLMGAQATPLFAAVSGG